ncbi:hypothetical protein [Streptomyces sp. NPDC017941]|uniref:hypothetical protein n=1 Tax=Streptomyces sp. NPDC017941 TaxID=3365018 RepID=UPI0037B6B747
MTSPADELSTASAKLRTLVTDLRDCRGPWYVVNREQRPYPQRIDNIGVPYIVATTTTDPTHPPTMADYIAAMDPRVGAALATALDEAATSAEQDGGIIQGSTAEALLDVARALSGNQP